MLSAVRIGDSIEALTCNGCKLVFPISDGIAILLSSRSRSEEIEKPLLLRLREKLTQGQLTDLAAPLERSLALIEQNRGAKSWAWEDEEFWRREYEAEVAAPQSKKWNDRLWQREGALNTLLSNATLHNGTVLDVGSGDGYTFRELLLPHCDAQTLYVAIDISIDALRLNRKRNPHRNALYLLSGADKLPLAPDSVDLLCLFGILHHTELKADNIDHVATVVRKGGFIFLHEALERPSPLPRSLRRTVEESAHEERVVESTIWNAIRRSKLEVLHSRRGLSSLFGGLMKFFPRQMLANKQLFAAALRLDSAVISTIGRVLPPFRAGEIVCLLRRAAL